MFSVAECARIVGGRVVRARAATPTRLIHDSRLVQPGDLFVAIKGARADGHAYLAAAFAHGACGALVSHVDSIPDTAYNLIVVDDTTAALTRIAAAWRETLPGTIVGITGTCGKTTTKHLLGHLLAGAAYVAPHSYNTAIGVPIALSAMTRTAQVGIFELGASAPGEIVPLARLLRPNIAIVTMVGRGHLAGFGSVDAVAAEKWAVVDALSHDGTAVVNIDSPPLAARVAAWPGNVITVGVAAGAVRGRIMQSVPTLILETDRLRLETRLLGRHNAVNVLLAAATALRFGVSAADIEARIRTFSPPPHRLNLVPARFGYIIDDTYNANPDSTTAALHTLAEFPGRRKAFVFGEMRELGETALGYHREIMELALTLGIVPIYPVGEMPRRVARETAVHAPEQIGIVPRADLPAQIQRDLTGTDNVLLVKGSHTLELDEMVAALVDRGIRQSR